MVLTKNKLILVIILTVIIFLLSIAITTYFSRNLKDSYRITAINETLVEKMFKQNPNSKFTFIDDPQDSRPSLTVIDFSKKTQKIYRLPQYSVSPLFSPNGEKIAFGVIQDENYGPGKLMILDLKEGKIADLKTKISSADSSDEWYSIRWSTDSKKIYFRRPHKPGEESLADLAQINIRDKRTKVIIKSNPLAEGEQIEDALFFGDISHKGDNLMWDFPLRKISILTKSGKYYQYDYYKVQYEIGKKINKEVRDVAGAAWADKDSAILTLNITKDGKTPKVELLNFPNFVVRKTWLLKNLPEGEEQIIIESSNLNGNKALISWGGYPSYTAGIFDINDGLRVISYPGGMPFNTKWISDNMFIAHSTQAGAMSGIKSGVWLFDTEEDEWSKVGNFYDFDFWSSKTSMKNTIPTTVIKK